jgi:hypothetical protein
VVLRIGDFRREKNDEKNVSIFLAEIKELLPLSPRIMETVPAGNRE